MRKDAGQITLTGSGCNVQAVLVGEVDLAAVQRFRAAHQRPGPIADLVAEHLTFIDSSGLKFLLQLQAANPGMRLVRPSRALTDLLEITGTASRFGLADATG
ncbi:STAS domain-containing protein [Georgenia faecalis]|uniref:STAS domain-containing protein n=1 Tax=Georgenia faecalis TaxID=2483799 RepID=A0ABV9DB37_9MICO|nr:STAS domain-containing protein [Georgenia faecalis]